ncbi:MAG: NUDIX hydrolase [Nitrospirales bacterium]|nr:MAG: NUDIX hydrolase [Nitrospirales bacterium]
MPLPPINFCSQCGSTVEQKIPQGEDRLRAVCPNCQTIHYQNPKIVAGCIPEWEGQVLMCRRAIEPRLGLWTFPAGFMEMGESSEEAAARETQEEALADVQITSLYAVYSLRRVDQVYIIYRGELRKREFGVGEESLEVQLVSLDDIPWKQLAFPVIHEALTRYVHDREQKSFGVHFGSIAPMTQMPAYESPAQ